jgi:hypothetical protein
MKNNKSFCLLDMFEFIIQNMDAATFRWKSYLLEER